MSQRKVRMSKKVREKKTRGGKKKKRTRQWTETQRIKVQAGGVLAREDVWIAVAPWSKQPDVHLAVHFCRSLRKRHLLRVLRFRLQRVRQPLQNQGRPTIRKQHLI